jgi:hypothetical protein
MRNLAAAALVLLTLLGSATTSRAALERPSYSPGDRWVYVVEGSMSGLPGMNDTGNGTFALDLAGRVAVEVAGFEDVDVNGTPTRAVRVLTRTSAYLNGMFEIPGFPVPVAVTGTISANASELWEDRGYQTIASSGTSTTIADVSFVITTRFEVRIRTFANVSVVQVNPFPLDVNETATASVRTDLVVNSTFVALGNETTFEERTTVDSEWRRGVLALETVRVDAGDFPAYRLNQTLGGFPGIPVTAASSEDYEIAHFSNDVGFYVKRVAYTNGTPTTEMRLKSYTYAARAPAFPWLPISLLVAVAVVAGIVLALWWRSRRRHDRVASRSDEGGRNERECGPGDGRAR